MEDTIMTKKEYMKPEMQVVEIMKSAPLLAGSVDANGMNTGLQNEEVIDGW
jgi:hypothetical protein